MKTTPTTGGSSMADIKTLVEEAKRLLDMYGAHCWEDGTNGSEDRTDQCKSSRRAVRSALDALAEAHQAEVSRLTRENEGLATDNAICRDAIAHALELVEQFAASPDGDDDMSQGAARATRRRLNEAIGQMRPRLMMEKDFSPKFGLRWKELRAENEGLAKDAARYRYLRSVGGRVWSITAEDGRPVTADDRSRVYDNCVDDARAAISGASGAQEGERT